jgi:O-antigen ligase
MSTARAAALVLQLGVLVAVIVALPYRLFELDRYFVPKELVLHATAVLLFAVLAARLARGAFRDRGMRFDTVDTLLAAFLLWSTLAAVFATNHWLAQRALGLSFASAVVFWSARHLGAAGFYRGLFVAGALAGVLAALTSLLQAYGVTSDYFSLNRAPGGTFGNRNFIAHFAAISVPALIYSVVSARRVIGALAGSVGMVIVASALVLSRSRAAWLATIASLALLALLLLISRRHWSSARARARLALLILAAFAGVAGALVLPNTLDWRSDSPYLDTARGLIDHREGSGAGRVAQYRNSLLIARDDPLFGAGPGNWPVTYPRFAPRNDPSLMNDGTTANPWPSSDWVGFVSERGLVAGLALLAFFGASFVGALRRWKNIQANDAVLAKVATAATITATIAVSAFDAVLLLAAPALLVWSVVGAGSGIARSGREFRVPRLLAISAIALSALVLLASVARSATQTVAITHVGGGGGRAGWESAARWDPGSYRINLRVAELNAARGRCSTARAYAHRALSLFPEAAAPRRVLRRCGVADLQERLVPRLPQPVVRHADSKLRAPAQLSCLRNLAPEEEQIGCDGERQLIDQRDEHLVQHAVPEREIARAVARSRHEIRDVALQSVCRTRPTHCTEYSYRHHEVRRGLHTVLQVRPCKIVLQSERQFDTPPILAGQKHESAASAHDALVRVALLRSRVDRRRELGVHQAAHEEMPPAELSGPG